MAGPAADGEVLTSRAWSGPPPTISAVISTFDRAGFLAELLGALEAQDLPGGEFEVVVVDNGSSDTTWEVLQDAVARTPLRLAAVRRAVNRGPAPGRNAGVAASRGPIVAITDDDCLPSPAWLREVRAAFADGTDVVQGTVQAEPAGHSVMGPWDHTIWVTAPTPFFETCNVAYRRTAFDRAGGFDEDDPLLHPPTGRAFGEDACLAWEVQRTGGGAGFASSALVHHRVIPSTYGRWLRDQRQLERFPGLARRSPLVARWLHFGVFLERRTMWFDLALVGLVAAAITRWPVLLVAVLPWGRSRWRASLRRVRGDRRAALAVLPRLAWADVVGFVAMARGSVRYRRLVI
jgi:glycosyltransferase involved in cell wall biosynthesis